MEYRKDDIVEVMRDLTPGGAVAEYNCYVGHRVGTRFRVLRVDEDKYGKYLLLDDGRHGLYTPTHAVFLYHRPKKFNLFKWMQSK